MIFNVEKKVFENRQSFFEKLNEGFPVSKDRLLKWGTDLDELVDIADGSQKLDNTTSLGFTNVELVDGLNLSFSSTFGGYENSKLVAMGGSVSTYEEIQQVFKPLVDHLGYPNSYFDDGKGYYFFACWETRMSSVELNMRDHHGGCWFQYKVSGRKKA